MDYFTAGAESRSRSLFRWQFFFFWGGGRSFRDYTEFKVANVAHLLVTESLVSKVLCPLIVLNTEEPPLYVSETALEVRTFLRAVRIGHHSGRSAFRQNANQSRSSI